MKETIGILGAGAMGSGIAQVAANAGHKVVLYDVNSKMVDNARSSLRKSYNSLVEKGKISSEVAEKNLKNIHFSSNTTDFRDCILLIEAIVEDLSVKQTAFQQIENIVSEDCILASNTSSLSIASIASACERPGRVLGIHFFNPAPVMPLVEVIPGIATDPEVFKNAKQLVDSWGKLTVVTKDTPGFIVNRVARPYYGESIRIYEEGIADFATIDWALKEFGGFRMGPFELMDFIGNDVNYKVTETVWTQFFYDPRYKPSLTQKRLYEAKFFGRKSGRGYYRYDGSPVSEPVKDEKLGREIFERVFAMLVNEAAEALYLNIASREDLDLAMTKGVNYPKGLLKWADDFGVEKVVMKLKELYDTYQEDRYRTSVLLSRKAESKGNFF